MYFDEGIKRKLLPLSNEQRLFFALTVCEKLYPNYLYFQSRCNWGDSNILSEAIEIMCQSLFKSDLFSNEEIAQYIHNVDAVTPDTEDFFDSSVSVALDACNAVYSSLNFMLDREIDHVVAVSIYARDTVYMSIINRDGLDMNLKGMDAIISKDPLMIKEITRQFSLLQELEGLKDKNINDELIQRHKGGSAVIDLETLK